MYLCRVCLLFTFMLCSGGMICVSVVELHVGVAVRPKAKHREIEC